MLGVMQRGTNSVTVTSLGRALAALFAGRVSMTLYYLAILLGLVVLYGRGDFSGVGFIYQAF